MKHIALLSVLALTMGGCVSAGKYKTAVEQGQALQNKVTGCEAELEALRTSSAAKAKDAQDKIDALQKSQADLEKEQKDLKKANELLKSDNEKLEKSMTERKVEFAKAVAKLKAVVDEMSALDEGGKPSK